MGGNMTTSDPPIHFTATPLRRGKLQSVIVSTSLVAGSGHTDC